MELAVSVLIVRGRSIGVLNDILMLRIIDTRLSITSQNGKVYYSLIFLKVTYAENLT